VLFVVVHRTALHIVVKWGLLLFTHCTTHPLLQIYPMTGTLTHLMTKAKHLQGQMDGIFVSFRVAQFLSEPGFRALCRDKHSVVAVETAKFLVALRTDTQQALTAKEEELAVQNGFKRIPGTRTSCVFLMCTWVMLTRVAVLFGNAAPVFRRRRDEQDLEDDVIFFQPV
jgi:hypothetical protein